jgi:hypothetical protein
LGLLPEDAPILHVAAKQPLAQTDNDLQLQFPEGIRNDEDMLSLAKLFSSISSFSTAFVLSRTIKKSSSAKFLGKLILQAACFVEIGRFFCGFLYAAPAIETWGGN